MFLRSAAAVLLLIGLLVAADPEPAAAATCTVGAGQSEEGPGVTIGAGGCPTQPPPGSAPPQGPDPAPSPGSADPVLTEPPPIWASEPSWSTRASGEPCIRLELRPGFEQNSPQGQAWDIRLIEMIRDARLDGSASPWCDGASADSAAASPALIAAAFSRTIPLPAIEPAIAPGIALTGLPAYLVIRNQDAFTVTEAAGTFGTMSVSLRAVAFEVDWGDGTVTTHDDGRTGTPFDGDPTQRISHIYTDVGHGNVVDIAARWVADWSLAGASGTVTGLTTSESLALPVYEWRSVRIAS